MATQKLAISPPSLLFTPIEEANNYPVTFPAIPFERIDLSKNQLISVQAIPSAVFASFDPVNNTYVNMTSIVSFAAMEGFGMAKGYAVAFTARKKDSPSANLLDNTVSLLAGGSEVGRIHIDAASQTCGVHLAWGAKGDARYILSGYGTAVTNGAIAASTDIYTKSGHGFQTGDPVTLTAITGGNGLTQGNLYYFHRLSSSTGYLCSTYANALAGTAVDVTVDGSSVTLTKQTDIGFALTQVDPNLLLDLRILGSDQ